MTDQDGPTLSGPTLEPHNGGDADALVVLLHGLGADGNDLIGLASQWAPDLPSVAWAAPNAPFPCDMAPMGYQWFSLQETSGPAMLAGIQSSAPALNAFLDAQLAARGLADDRLLLVGFSQGTMMSLYVAPRRANACAGVVGFSGALLAADTLIDEATARPPLLLVHGDADPVVPVRASIMANEALQNAGFDVELMVRPGLPHGIDPEGAAAALAFIKARLGG